MIRSRYFRLFCIPFFQITFTIKISIRITCKIGIYITLQLISINYLQLQHVLAKSDTMMSVVKDLFGDDPKVKTVILNIY